MQDPIEYLNDFIKNGKMDMIPFMQLEKKRGIIIVEAIKLFYYKIYNLLSYG